MLLPIPILHQSLSSLLCVNSLPFYKSTRLFVVKMMMGNMNRVLHLLQIRTADMQSRRRWRRRRRRHATACI